MSENLILFVLSIVVLTGMVSLLVRQLTKKGIPSKAYDEWRKDLWEKGFTLEEARPLKMWEALRIHGLNAFSFASYQYKHFAKIKATNDDGEEKHFLASMTLTFNNKVLEKNMRPINKDAV